MIAWTEAVLKTIAPYTIGESYQNFPNLAIGNWQSEYYGENFDRLVDVKTKYDPGDFFSNEQSIPTLRA
jgi:FAD/FMN-containing dehydrogenase